MAGDGPTGHGDDTGRGRAAGRRRSGTPQPQWGTTSSSATSRDGGGHRPGPPGPGTATDRPRATVPTGADPPQRGRQLGRGPGHRRRRRPGGRRPHDPGPELLPGRQRGVPRDGPQLRRGGGHRLAARTLLGGHAVAAAGRPAPGVPRGGVLRRPVTPPAAPRRTGTRPRGRGAAAPTGPARRLVVHVPGPRPDVQAPGGRGVRAGRPPHDGPDGRAHVAGFDTPAVLAAMRARAAVHGTTAPGGDDATAGRSGTAVGWGHGDGGTAGVAGTTGPDGTGDGTTGGPAGPEPVYSSGEFWGDLSVLPNWEHWGPSPGSTTVTPARSRRRCGA